MKNKIKMLGAIVLAALMVIACSNNTTTKGGDGNGNGDPVKEYKDGKFEITGVTSANEAIADMIMEVWVEEKSKYTDKLATLISVVFELTAESKVSVFENNILTITFSDTAAISVLELFGESVVRTTIASSFTSAFNQVSE